MVCRYARVGGGAVGSTPQPSDCTCASGGSGICGDRIRTLAGVNSRGTGEMDMALSAYLTLAGQKQGPINGSVTEKGRENSILVHSYENLITSPRDAASGLATGKRVHQPITVTKEMDRSSVLLWNALVNNENLTSWVLKIWTPTQ